MPRILSYDISQEQFNKGVALVDLDFVINEANKITVEDAGSMHIINAIMCSAKSIKVLIDTTKSTNECLTIKMRVC